MQPYLFPYIGYFQLINSVDEFVLYDDVSFIKQGWINRNNILLNGARHLFTIPVQGISSHSPINQTMISDKPVNWQAKLLGTLAQAYKKAPFFKDVFPIVEAVLGDCSGKNIATVSAKSLSAVMQYLSIETNLITSSAVFENEHLKNEGRVIDICLKQEADEYFNAIGGSELYSRDHFLTNGIKLHFIKSRPVSYTQFKDEFVAGLSIIDVLMFNNVGEIANMLNEYELA